MRKGIGISLILLSLIIGGSLISSYLIYSDGVYYGYLGYCKDVELPYFTAIWAGGLYMLLLSLTYCIYLESFEKFDNLKKIYPFFLVAFLAMLAIIAYNVYQFPYLRRSFGFMNQRDMIVGLRNPLIGISTLYSIILAWLIFCFKLKTGSYRKLSVFAYLFIAIILTIITRSILAEYEVCYG